MKWAITVLVVITFAISSNGKKVSPNPSERGITLIGPDPNYECAGNGAFPHDTRCDLYYDCWEGVANLMGCTEDTMFHIEWQACELDVDCGDRIRPNGTNPTSPVPTGSTTTRLTTTTTRRPGTNPPDSPDCSPDHHGAFYPHPRYCEQYWECDNWDSLLHFCPGDQLFDLRYMGCNFPEDVDCGERLRPNGTTGRPPTTKPPGGTEEPPEYECNPENDGAFPHEIYCEKYWDCYRGVATLLACRDDWLFDLRWAGCEVPSEVDCGNRIRPNGTNPTTTTPRTTTTTPRTTTTTRAPVTGDPEEFVCPQPDGLFPDPADCSTYYQCSNGHPNKMSCPRPLLYHDTASICDFPDKVNCGTRPIPT